MSDSDSEKNSAQLEPEFRDMRIEEGDAQEEEGEGTGTIKVKVEDDNDRQGPSPTLITIPPKPKSKATTQSPVKKQSPDLSPSSKEEHEEVVGGDITLKMEPGKAPKLSRAASQKIISRPPPLFLDLPDVTEESKRTFTVLPECTYGNKYLGTTEHALECDCPEEWNCGCGAACQNQRFLRKQYADVTVIKTEKKGYGLRANIDLKPNDFIFEYIGEVINEATFRRRMIQYDEEGIKHFYFMSLTKGEFVDATKKGNLGRFCNHSCNPNCYVDKWVVGDKLRMGIFAERKIKVGEELVFNYNVDRYGADPQPCYCGEPNCTGYIGGKQQSNQATKLSHATIEALGIDDGDGWDTAVAKKPRKKKKDEDDEEYVNDIQPRFLEESGVTKVMAALMQCKEKWIAVKLLSRIQRSNDEKVGNRVIRMHGYTILKSTLNTWMDDFNVVLQVLDILDKLPRITRNKIQDSKIEETVEKLKTCGDERVEAQAAKLIEAWSKLEMGYRIPRMKRDPNAGTPVRIENHFERREKVRERSKSRSRSPSVDAPRGPSAAPSGPRSSMPQRNPSYYNGPRPPFRPRLPFGALPPGWFQATSDNGATYYYSATGATQWQRPTIPAAQPPPPPPKAKANAQRLQDIISSITQHATPKNQASASTTPQPVTDEPKQEKKSRGGKWKDLPQEKKEKIYENTIFPHVKSVTDHYRKKLEKDDLKRLAKEVHDLQIELTYLTDIRIKVAKKVVRGDFKHNKVQDPTAKISSKHERTIRKFVKDFMDKAVVKKAARDQEKAKRKARESGAGKAPVKTGTPETPKADARAEKEDSDDEMLGLLDDEDEHSHDASPADSLSADLKRKREEDDDHGSPKKSRTDTPPAPPPPPPPPPTEDMPTDMDDSGLTSTEDASNSFHSEAPEAVNGGSACGKSTLCSELVADRVKQSEDSSKTENYPSPMQLATPPTTTNGSCEHDSNGKDGGREFGDPDTRRRPEVEVNGSP
ncbi:hypothetical protein K469DRAFT_690471 [Zopfia rhizophila CBS 207.26]|uniref:Histone-lysine N-methyltransferase, H3 lysine-36 specific n=1 Tax=Zopfia rhizophila CBS 207.26 TaxID=1314779 RepID=A0A6A6DT04_9PEZI|nr:hypothetical protein K469DRAFT_690471 [Zopfia rhizophila CBS 207.26]